MYIRNHFELQGHLPAAILKRGNWHMKAGSDLYRILTSKSGNDQVVSLEGPPMLATWFQS